MRFLRIVLVLALAGAGYQYYSKSQRAKPKEAAPGGFVSLPPLSGVDTSAVIIFAPMNCPREAGRRADALEQELRARGIPVTRTSSASFEVADPDPATVDHVNSVMTGELPIVMVRGRGKANPSADDVVAEYGSKGR